MQNKPPESSFLYSDTNKRYYSFSYFLKQKFGCRVVKIPLDAGFTCPNLDGSKGWGGCSYCSGRGSGEFAGNPAESITEQFFAVQKLTASKWPDAKFIPYFQAHTNTYAPLAVLKEKYQEALSLPDVVGLSIATRADCISQDCADYLAELSEDIYLEVELGLQSVSDATGERIHRGHSYAEFLQGYHKLQSRGVPVCVHIINGLPGESREQMLQTVRTLSKLDLHSMKIHLLHVLQGTALAEQFAAAEFELLSKEEYVEIVCDQLELLPPQVILQRLTGDGDRQTLIGPLWSRNKRAVLNAIDQEMAKRNSYQGLRCVL